MIRALYTAASGMMAQETNLDNIANNLANSSTAGFRRRRVQFEDLVYQTLVMPGAAASQQTTMVAGLQVGLGTRTAASEVIQLQGDFSQTGNPLDMTIQGQGFFQVLLPDGQTAYTRAGSFHLDAQGNLVTQDGNPVQPSVAIPPGATSMTVAQDGTNSTGSNLFLATTASGDPVIGTPGGSEGLGSIQQGMLEQSNVSVVDEFVQMIVAQRSYEANSRVVNAADQMLQNINTLGR